jgi:hypothetical protein
MASQRFKDQITDFRMTETDQMTIATGLAAPDRGVRSMKFVEKTGRMTATCLDPARCMTPSSLRSHGPNDHPASLRHSIFGSKRARKISASSGSSQ